jgi:hypothetical protein
MTSILQDHKTLPKKRRCVYVRRLDGLREGYKISLIHVKQRSLKIIIQNNKNKHSFVKGTAIMKGTVFAFLILLCVATLAEKEENKPELFTGFVDYVRGLISPKEPGIQLPPELPSKVIPNHLKTVRERLESVTIEAEE